MAKERYKITHRKAVTLAKKYPSQMRPAMAPMPLKVMPDGDELEMEIEGTPSSANGYVAVGFSEDQKMGNDMVVFCARFNNAVKGGLARNVRPPRVENNTGVQTIVSATTQGDAIKCVIRQVIKPEDRPELFDLSLSYYILFARGPYVEKDGRAEIQNHTPQGRYVGKEVSLADVTGRGTNTTGDGDEPKPESTLYGLAMKKHSVKARDPAKWWEIGWGCQKSELGTLRFRIFMILGK
ncbi:DOMON domain protein, partial [Teladorsagia circumcincta]